MKKLTLEQFLKDVDSHILTINLDQGVYRDLTIAKPDNITMHYNITTRPGYLMITGDMGAYTFCRANDMFGFFRQENTYSINPGYWGEKVKAGVVAEFDIEVANKSLEGFLTDHFESLDLSDPEDIAKSKAALDAVTEFLINNRNSSEFEFWQEIQNWDEDDAGGLDLTDFFEASTTSKTFNFIWCCFAIVHAIKLYDAQKNQESAA